MNKKKNIIISIIIVVVLTVLVAGASYAYIVAATGGASTEASSGKLDVNYVKPSDITGKLSASSTRNDGLRGAASASLNAGSIGALFDMYITPTALTNLNIPALKWEVEGVREGSIVCSNNGDFSSASVGTKIKVIDGCELSSTITTFNVYIWLDASLIEFPISGANFGAKITADSVPITGEF